MSMDFIHRTMKPLYIATEQSEFFVLRLWKNAQSGKKTIRERRSTSCDLVSHSIASPPPLDAVFAIR